MIEKDNKKVVKSWAMFDWANSSYNLVITSTIFPAYYTAITTTEQFGDKVKFFGFDFVNTALSNYVLAAAYLVIAMISPLLTSMADFHGNKKIFLKLFTWLGGLACAGLYFFTLETLEVSLIFFALAALGYCGGIVFINSYLPEIASKENQDAVSAKGFAYGYVGSVILQVICFIFVLKPELFGITDAGFPARLSFLLVGIWWIGFAQISIRVLPKGSPNFKAAEKVKLLNGFDNLKKVWHEVSKMTVLKKYLASYFFSAMGVQTIMLVAASFGEKILQLGTSKLIATILIIQLVAIGGAILMSKLSHRYGNIKVLIAVVSIWIVVCISAYFITTEYQFYVLAAVVGTIMGGIQSLSRSTFSKLIPEQTSDNASFFSFYDVTEKLAIVAGLFSFGLIEEMTGNMRYSALFLGIFFVIAISILFSLVIKEKKSLKNYQI
ncbi:major facilitator superfamily MFS_1 [Pseudopedobacter saltans DSM 12145]|uniref:Major facilitator superfamily MFS_1 n=1 Tax=Pseudopedobacter saltans (strain ATCC 51119 / DSM 12145 / JCM 21818 / CCUG 39354 / LMG 10337 / NBRC 100064 / NCIMB 13643) TaxID=762903 RepID=F0S5T4_PSESL|nr:MFS transporter [Pseudopedobacter saltans]ADY51005.1 major facilitator superfamily MFS_1 [Pseudopedobacter saltans DSM 12145]